MKLPTVGKLLDLCKCGCNNPKFLSIYVEMLSNISCRGASDARLIGHGDARGTMLENSTLVTVDQIASEMGLRIDTTLKSKIGKNVAKGFRRHHPEAAVESVEKFVNGEMRHVRAYPRWFKESIESQIRALL